MMKSANLGFDYYEKGFIITKIPEDLLLFFWAEIYTTNWIKSKSVFQTVPDWYIEGQPVDIQGHDAHQEYEYQANKLNLQNSPYSLRVLANDLICSSIFDFLRINRPIHEISAINLWNGAEDDDFHQDVIDGTNTLVLCYLADEEWKEEWGGSLTVTKKLFDKDVYTTKVLPNTATMIIINNDNPLFMHKVEGMKKEKNRYTFAFSYNWKIK